MTQEAIFIPFFCLMLLTIIVWCYMYYLRLTFFVREKINPQSVATTRDMMNLVPDRISTPSENLANLFELPVLFYALCIYLYVTAQVTTSYLVLAWLFVLFRAGHSLVHCTYNRVMHRFALYMVSSLLLWVAIVMAAIAAIMM